MNWLTNFIRPRIRSLVSQKDVPENLWQKCPSCQGMLFHAEMKKNLNVCYHCGYHLRIPAAEYFRLLFDKETYEVVPTPRVPFDPLKFRDRKKYADRIRESQTKTKNQDAMLIAKGLIGGQKAVIAVFDFEFMGGSMGTGVGEAIVKAAEVAVQTRSALILIPSSGGARMQEGMLSLMQMPRTIVAVNQVQEAGLPYIVLLTNPTTGGVSASFAMIGDLHLAEPGATIGFAGKRVIEETIREKLPEDFQTAEYLREHGMVDMVVARPDLHSTFARILGLLMNPVRGTNTSVKGGRPAGAYPNSSPRSRKDANSLTPSTAPGATLPQITSRPEPPIRKPANTQDQDATLNEPVKAARKF